MVLGGTIFRYPKALAHFAHPNCRPGFSVASFAAHPVERYSQFSIGPMSGKLAQRIDGGGRHIAGIATRLDARHAHLSVPPPGPMDQQHGFIGRLVKITDDFLDQDMDEPLFCSRIRQRRIPCRRQVMSKLEESGAIDFRARPWLSPQILNPALKFGHALKGAVPARFQFTGDVAFGRVHQFVPARGKNMS